MAGGEEGVIAGARPSPNIWNSPSVYEIENDAFDRDGRVEDAMRSICDWAGREVLDIGCGTGFHLSRLAASARHVTGVEPHHRLRALALRRTRRTPNVTVLGGLAEDLPVPDSSVEVAHACWAYFFGPGSEPGLAELGRVMRPGGAAFVIDNDAERSTFGSWFRQGFPEVSPGEVARFWAENGWARERLECAWTFETREDLDAVVRIELPTALAARVLEEYAGGLRIDYAVNLWWRRF